MAGVLGYSVIVGLTTVGFVHWLEGADLYRGGWALQAKGTLVAVVAGLAGGALAGLLGGRRPLLHSLAVLPLLVIDTLYVLFVFPRTTPAWFELAGSLTLMAATVAGGWVVGALRRRGAAPSPVAAVFLLVTIPALAAPSRAAQVAEGPRVNGPRLLSLLEDLARFGATPDGGVQRLAYSEEDRRARDWVAERMQGAGLEVIIDPAGNLVGRRPGSEDLPPILLGSHIDTVPHGGAYDGSVGSMAALEVAWTLEDQGLETRHPLEVAIFQNEEGGLVGSEAMAGTLEAAALSRVSQSGRTLREGIAFLGGDPDRLVEASRPPGSIAAYLELHIEQGAVLEEAGVDIGVVEGIVGIVWWDVTVEGFANHAGTTPMDRRRDALLAAARFVDAVNRVATSVPGRQVATVGRIEAEPGAPNVIPGRVTLSLEIRDLDGAKIETLFEGMRAEAGRIAEATGISFAFEDQELGIEPAPTDERLRTAVERSASSLGLSHRRMPSGAGHDAQSLAPLGPIGMIFIPSIGGVSHSPEELSRSEDVVRGADVLLRTVLEIDGGR